MTHSDLAENFEEFKVEKQNLIDSRLQTLIHRCQLRIRRQIRENGMRVCHIESIVVECGNLMKRIHSTEGCRAMLILIQINLAQLKTLIRVKWKRESEIRK